MKAKDELLISINSIDGNANFNEDSKSSKSLALNKFIYGAVPVLPCKFMKLVDKKPVPILNNDISCVSYVSGAGKKMYEMKFKSEESRYLWILMDAAYHLTGNWAAAALIVINLGDNKLNRFIYGEDDTWRIYDTYSQRCEIEVE